MTNYSDFDASAFLALARSAARASALARDCACMSFSWSSSNDNLRTMRQYSSSWGSLYRSISTNSSESQPHAATYSSGMASRVETKLPAVFCNLGMLQARGRSSKSLAPRIILTEHTVWVPNEVTRSATKAQARRAEMFRGGRSLRGLGALYSSPANMRYPYRNIRVGSF